MARIKINDLRQGHQLTEDALRKVTGGAVYMKIPDIEGESRINRDKWVDVLSFSTISSSDLLR